MSEDDRLDDLLARLEDLRRRGLDPTAEELCPDDPVLRERLREEMGRYRAPEPPTSRPSIPGVTLGHEIGRGTMGVVYRGRLGRRGRDVAVKVFRGGVLAGHADRARFRAEARAMARLEHPNIVAIYGHGEADGLPYLVLEHLEGGSLADRTMGEPQPPRWSALLTRTLALAAAEAHDRGVIHRDLNPRNVVFTADGSPKITDYGLAIFLDQDEGCARTWQAPGSPGYMAPEQVGASRAPIGPAADVYALGAILYELLTGRPPLLGDGFYQTLELIRDRAPARPRDSRPDVPQALELVCLKCLEKEPRRRYATADDLADDLGRFLAGEPVAARPVGPLRRLRAWARVHRGLAAPAAAALLSLAVLAAAATAVARREADRAGALEYARRIQLAGRALAGNRVDRVREMLASCPADRRGWEWLCLDRLRREDAPIIHAHDRRVTSLAFSPDGSEIVTGSWDRTARTWDVRTGGPRATFRGHDDKVTDAVFGPGGRLVATSGQDGTVRLWDAADGRPIRKFSEPGAKLFGVAFSPDGARVAAAGEPCGVVVWDVSTGRQVARFRAEDGESLYYLAFSPDGARVAAAGEPGLAGIWDAATGRPIAVERRPGWRHARCIWFDAGGACRAILNDASDSAALVELGSGRPPVRFDGHSDTLTDFAPSPDGARLASSSRDKTVRIWDVRGEELLALPAAERAVLGVAWSPDGSRLASIGEDGSLRIYDASPSPPGERLGRDLGTVAELRGSATDVAFSPDGSRLAWSGDGGVWTRGVEPSPARRLVSTRVRMQGLAFSPDGSRLAAAGAKGTALLLSLATGNVLRWFEGHSGTVYRAAFSPDGSRLATSSGDETVRVWDAGDGRLLLCLDAGDESLAVAFDPDGRRVAAGGGADVRLWDAATGGLDATFRGVGGEVWCLAFSPDGSLAAVVGADERVTIRDASSGEVLRVFSGHTAPVYRVAFSPDGSRVASAGRDRTARIWDLAGRADPIVMRGHRGPVRGLSFHPDGSRLATAGEDGLVKLWDASP